ncbi:hypothetical protein [Anaerohalosphaera lusitana]|uniref:hypothetical protein n=1 Tax=Anaerohalosphaera lusitana TaxID=1936003 RepID=UPI0011BAB8BB|nr:hypothetical protein [Anaerohalosphaera lusitana]
MADDVFEHIVVAPLVVLGGVEDVRFISLDVAGEFVLFVAAVADHLARDGELVERGQIAKLDGVAAGARDAAAGLDPPALHAGVEQIFQRVRLDGLVGGLYAAALAEDVELLGGDHAGEPYLAVGAVGVVGGDDLHVLIAVAGCVVAAEQGLTVREKALAVSDLQLGGAHLRGDRLLAAQRLDVRAGDPLGVPARLHPDVYLFVLITLLCHRLSLFLFFTTRYAVGLRDHLP